MQGVYARKPAIERFIEKTRNDKSGCLLWAASKIPSGYGRFDNQYAHRFAWEYVYGKIPPGLFILHKCDNPSCVNVSHLFLGTQKDNIEDMRKKGRHPKIRPKSEIQ